jgi:hypothetical protein
LPTPFESAQLNLQLFDMRREPVLREARAWFTRDFNPETFEEFQALSRGEHNPWFRMVLSYWEMSASLVTGGAVDGDAFRAAHGEVFAIFCKIQPFLQELRSASHEPTLCRHLEKVVMADPDALAIMERRRDRLRASAQNRQSWDGPSTRP